MKKAKPLFSLLFLALFLGSGKQYGYVITLPADPYAVIFLRETGPKPTYEPPRRTVPEEYRDLFASASACAGIPPGVLESIAYVESGFDPGAESPLRGDGNHDMGMMQFNTKCLDWYAGHYTDGAPFDPMDPAEAVPVAAKHIGFLFGRYGHWPTVCLAYNAGAGAVDRGEVPESSDDYLARVYRGGL